MGSYLEKLFSVAGKTVFITGAGSGIGQHCAALFSKLGSQVVYTDVNQEGLDSTEKLIDSSKALKLKLDITDQEAVRNAVHQAIEKFKKIDVLINCAALIDYCPMMKVTKEIWDRTYQVDLLGTWFVSKEIAAIMIDQKISGSIIFVSSALAHRAQRNLIPYSSIKAAVSHMTHTLGLELAPYNIRVNEFAPGIVKTAMVETFLDTEEGKKVLENIPFKRAASLSEIEAPILFLASDAASYISGATLKVDGGLAFNHIPQE